jgi:hypothetical protein
MKTSNNKNGTSNGKWLNQDLAEAKLVSLFRELVNHSGFGELKVEIRILKNGDKAVVLSAGRQFRIVLKPFPKGKDN